MKTKCFLSLFLFLFSFSLFAIGPTDYTIDIDLILESSKEKISPRWQSSIVKVTEINGKIKPKLVVFLPSNYFIIGSQYRRSKGLNRYQLDIRRTQQKYKLKIKQGQNEVFAILIINIQPLSNRVFSSVNCKNLSFSAEVESNDFQWFYGECSHIGKKVRVTLYNVFDGYKRHESKVISANRQETIAGYNAFYKGRKKSSFTAKKSLSSNEEPQENQVRVGARAFEINQVKSIMPYFEFHQFIDEKEFFEHFDAKVSFKGNLSPLTLNSLDFRHYIADASFYYTKFEDVIPFFTFDAQYLKFDANNSSFSPVPNLRSTKLSYLSSQIGIKKKFDQLDISISHSLLSTAQRYKQKRIELEYFLKELSWSVFFDDLEYKKAQSMINIQSVGVSFGKYF